MEVISKKAFNLNRNKLPEVSVYSIPTTLLVVSKRKVTTMPFGTTAGEMDSDRTVVLR
jgi:hypothetical protein